MTHATREAFPILLGSRLDLCLSLVGAIKSAASSLTLSSGEQLHSVSLKSGFLHSNIFVSNSLIHLYARRGHLLSARRLFLSATLLNNASWNILLAAYVRFPCPGLYHARVLFDKIPHKDRVSYTTMIMGLSKHGSSVESLALFRDMMVASVTPNDVTLASVLSSCSRLNGGIGWTGKMVHAVAVKCGLDELLLVATNLVHDYVVTLNFEDAEAVFDRMPEKNTVTWNVLLKGYAKAGWINAARSVFERTPDKDLVSWGTMIDGFLLANSLEEALLAFRHMLQDVEARPNEVMLVNLLSACCRCSAICEGQQLHAVILKAGLDSHQFVHTTLIHFYGECHMMDLSLLLFQSRSNDNISSWNAVIAGFLRNNELNAARQLFDDMPDRDVVSWSTMIAGYAQHRQHELALELFHVMQTTFIQPNEITLVSVLSAIAGCGSFEEGKRVHHYINENFVPLTDNLCAGLIDMYAKCGRIHKAVCLFDYVRSFAGVSSWNAIISGLAMHGHADESLCSFLKFTGNKD
ncbi:hypothetical protein HPP92_010621 [Vanilla planifolia]|uniref:Pentatricopeptide repeat-containing protein n=1 Tax=Vanilla planifolia TaxID=51239 RepID=A0A835R4G7_VANPL|nr:hypothetical protein HPP92_010621 [Vanilla planifolia]